MAQIIGLPKLSPTMEEGVLVRWVKKQGDKVSPGDLVAEVETDKANMDFNIEDEGTLLALLASEGQTVKLGAPVAIIGKPGEDIAALVAQARSGTGGTRISPSAPNAAAQPAAAAPALVAPVMAAAPAIGTTIPAPHSAPPATVRPAASGTPAPAGGTATFSAPPLAATHAPAPAPATALPGSAPGNAPLLASPLAKTLALELGIDLRGVTGTGPGGRIVERDVRARAEAGGTPAGVVASAVGATGSTAYATITGATAAPVAMSGGVSQAIEVPLSAATAMPSALIAKREADWANYGDFTDIPASNMRKRIAERLTEAKNSAPHFYLMRQVDAAPLLAFRARLNDLLAGKGKISVNDLVIKAVALALRRVPACNATWTGEGIRRFHHVHVGVAVAIDDGLVTPVIRDADLKGIGSIGGEVADLATRARGRQLKAHEISGSTFTVSNLGMFGIERFTAIINPPEAGILAIGAVVDTPVVVDGAVVAGKRMTLTMSCDHRVIDGALGAQFLGAVVELLEKPESLAL